MNLPTYLRPRATLATLVLACTMPGASTLAWAQTPAPAPAPAVAPAAPPVDPALQRAAAAKGAVTTASGLVFLSMKEGNGAAPAASDVVRVHYRGTFPDGREFDSSHKRGQPASFPLNRVISCWTEGLQMMKVGGSARLTCPSAIAYGERGTPGGPIPPNAVLQFEVELLGINP